VNPQNFFAELKRRNVYKVAVGYAIVAWLLIQAAPEDRESLAGVLVQSLEDAPASEVDAAWIEEAEQRYQKWRARDTDGISSEKFFSEIRRDLRCR
jgi:hypothetical protein